MDAKTNKKQLKQLQSEAFAVIKAWFKYLDALNDYEVQLEKSNAEGTTPPGGPPNPPGIPHG